MRLENYPLTYERNGGKCEPILKWKCERKNGTWESCQQTLDTAYIGLTEDVGSPYRFHFNNHFGGIYANDSYGDTSDIEIKFRYYGQMDRNNQPAPLLSSDTTLQLY